MFKRLKGSIFLLLMVMVVSACSAKLEVSKEKEVVENAQTVVGETEVKENLGMADVEALAASDGSPTEKADAAEGIARKYKPTADELVSFQEYIVAEYKIRNTWVISTMHHICL